MTNPSHDELGHAVVAIGGERFAMPQVRIATLQRLSELGVAQWNAGQWELTPVGRKLLKACMDGEDSLRCLDEQQNAARSEIAN